jgi:hypothetical protein
MLAAGLEELATLHVVVMPRSEAGVHTGWQVGIQLPVAMAGGGSGWWCRMPYHCSVCVLHKPLIKWLLLFTPPS